MTRFNVPNNATRQYYLWMHIPSRALASLTLVAHAALNAKQAKR